MDIVHSLFDAAHRPAREKLGDPPSAVDIPLADAHLGPDARSAAAPPFDSIPTTPQAQLAASDSVVSARMSRLLAVMAEGVALGYIEGSELDQNIRIWGIAPSTSAPARYTFQLADVQDPSSTRADDIFRGCMRAKLLSLSGASKTWKEFSDAAPEDRLALLQGLATSLRHYEFVKSVTLLARESRLLDAEAGKELLRDVNRATQGSRAGHTLVFLCQLEKESQQSLTEARECGALNDEQLTRAIRKPDILARMDEVQDFEFKRSLFASYEMTMRRAAEFGILP